MLDAPGPPLLTTRVDAANMKPPYFLNVDLDIESKTPLRSLTRALGEKVCDYQPPVGRSKR